MADAVLLVADHGVNVDIFDTAENIALHERIHLFQVFDQFLDLHAFRTILLVIAGRAGIGKLAGTLDEMQTVIISPRLDIILTHQIQRADRNIMQTAAIFSYAPLPGATQKRASNIPLMKTA